MKTGLSSKAQALPYPFLIDEGTLYKIDNLLEESFLTKVSDYIAKIGQGFETEQDVKNYIKSEQEAQKKREKYLQDNGVDVKKFKEQLKNSDPVNIDWSFLMSSLIDEAKHTTSSTTVLKNIGAVGMVLAFNTLILSIFLTMIVPLVGGQAGFGIALFLTAIIAAPLTEEMYKRLSGSKNQGFTSNIVFNAVEFTLYMSGAGAAGIPIILLFVFRVLAVGLHTVLTLLHQKGKILDKYKEDFKLDDFKKDQTFRDMSHKTAMLIHGLWNGLHPAIAAGLAVASNDVMGVDIARKKKTKNNFNK